MSSRFNTLYLGEPDEAAEALEHSDAVGVTDHDVDELRIALINALKRIATLEQQVGELREPVR